MTNALSGLGSRYFAALAYADYRWLWMASMGGASAYWALIVARGVLVLDMSDSSAQVGIVTFAAMGPRFIVPPLAGYLADRFNRRDVLNAVYWVNTLSTALLAFLAVAGMLELWHLLVLSVLNGTARTFQMTSTASLVPNLVPREKLLNAVSLNSATQQGSRLIGPGLIAPLLLFWGPESAFIGSAVFYAIGVLLVGRIRTQSTGGLGRGSSVLGSLGHATVAVWQHPKLRVLFIIVALHCAMTMSFESMFPIISRDALDVGAEGVSYLMMAVGAGGMASALLVAGVRQEAARGRLLFITGVVSGVALLGLAAATTMPVALVSAAAMGASQAAFMAILAAMVQTLAPDEMRGRISGLNQINIGGTMAVLNLVNGFAADSFGAPLVLTVLGVGFTIIMFLSLVAAGLRGVYAQGVPLGARAPAAAA